MNIITQRFVFNECTEHNKLCLVLCLGFFPDDSLSSVFGDI